MRLSSGRQEPQLVPHCSVACSAARRCARRVPRAAARARRSAASVTSKQLQTCLPRDATRDRRLGAGRQQQPAVGLRRQLVLQQRLDPGLGAGVAGQQEAFEPRVVRPARTSAHGAALAVLARRRSAARRAPARPSSASMRASSVVGRRLVRGGAEQHAGALARRQRPRAKGTQRAKGTRHQRAQRLARVQRLVLPAARPRPAATRAARPSGSSPPRA